MYGDVQSQMLMYFDTPAMRSVCHDDDDDDGDGVWWLQ